MAKLIDAKIQAGQAIRASNFEFVPLVRKIRIQPPDYRGILLWGTPEAVVVQSPNGDQAVFPIRDHTRRAQMLLLGIGLLGSFLIWLTLRWR